MACLAARERVERTTVLEPRAVFDIHSVRWILGKRPVVLEALDGFDG